MDGELCLPDLAVAEKTHPTLVCPKSRNWNLLVELVSGLDVSVPAGHLCCRSKQRAHYLLRYQAYHPLKLEISSKATCLNAAVMCLKHGAAKAQKVIDQELVQIEK